MSPYEPDIGNDLPVGRIGERLQRFIRLSVLEFLAGELRALGADLQPFSLHAAGYERTGRVFAEEVGPTASWAS